MFIKLKIIFTDFVKELNHHSKGVYFSNLKQEYILNYPGVVRFYIRKVKYE